MQITRFATATAPYGFAHPSLVASLLVAMLLLGSCFGSANSAPGFYAPDDYPQRLSQWNLLVKRGDLLALGKDVHVYDINMPLFSDYAGKFRTLWLPPNTKLRMRADGQPGFDYPLGAILSKTFFYQQAPTTSVQTIPVKNPARASVQKTSTFRSSGGALNLAGRVPIETRLLVNHDDGWHAVSYQWRGDEAYLAITGAIVPLSLHDGATAEITEFSYLIPSRNQCAGCHATNHSTGQLLPIGLHQAQLQRVAPGNPKLEQQQVWQQRGWLTAPPITNTQPMPTWEQHNANTQDQARAYLDSNCGHCHNPNGPADTSALDLSLANQNQESLGVCKPPIAAGRGSGGHLYSIVPGNPDASILIHRLASTELRSRMPEVGRSLEHTEGVSLVRAWIASMSGECR